jgi:hypothetical protein
VPSAKPGTQRSAVASAAQRGNQAALRVEPADVDVAKMKVMDGDVASHRKPLPLRGAHHVHAFAVDSRQMCTCTPVVRTSARIEASAIVSAAGGIEGKAEARRNFAFVRDAALREMRVLRPQPHAVAERRRVLHRAKQHAGVDQRRLGLRERDTAGFGELAHLGELDALERTRQRSDRIDVRLVERRARCFSICTSPARRAADRCRAGTRGS